MEDTVKSSDSVSTSEADSVANDVAMWAMEYGIVRLILSHLSMKDLSAAAQVCKTWWQASQVEKRYRTDIYTFFSNYKLLKKGDKCPDFFSTLTKLVRSLPKLCVMVQTSRAGPFSRYDQHWQSADPPPGREEEGFLDDTSAEDLPLIPLKDLTKHLHELLPKNCPVLNMRASGVVGTPFKKGASTEIENGEAYGLFLIPEMPQCLIKHFCLDKTCSRKVQKQISSGPSAQVDSLMGLQPSDRVKCLLLFSNDLHQGSDLSQHLAEYIIKRESEQVAIGGGFIDYFDNMGDDMPAELHGILGIAFCGDGVRAASTVIPYNVYDPKEVEVIIKKLHDSFPVGTQSIAFMFACVARGQELYGYAPNQESSIFRKYYPDTPLLGFFGNGEIGIDCLPPKVAEEKDRSFKNLTSPPAKKSKPNILHGNTTIFVVLSFTDS